MENEIISQTPTIPPIPPPSPPPFTFSKKQKFIITILIFLILIVIGAFVFSLQKKQREALEAKITPTLPAGLPSLTPTIPTATPSITPTKKPYTFIPLKNAWNNKTTFIDPAISISFSYPSYFERHVTDIEKENKEWAQTYKNDLTVRQPLYTSFFAASISTPWPDPFPTDGDSNTICHNNMYVYVSAYTNPKNLSLYDFIADLNKTYAGGGRTETFDTYKQDLKTTSIPQEGSYVFTGIEGENPVKTVYFIHKNTIYTFLLGGGCGTGDKYTREAEQVFTKILQSITFL